MLEEDRVEKALHFLQQSATTIGQARGHMVYCEGNLRRIKSLQMIGMEGSVADRETRAYASDEYRKALEDQENAIAEYETLRAHREAAQYFIDVWRTQQSSKKAGL